MVCSSTTDTRNGADETLAETGENAFLSRLLPQLPGNANLIVGPGDDCAVAATPGGGYDLLLKTDSVAEGVHFLRGTPPQLIGRKALARALSDIAAMGGEPEHALITLLVSPGRATRDIEELCLGLSELAETWGVSLAGGETSSLPFDGLIVSIALTGRVPRGQAILRSTAHPGDLLAVTGRLGGSYPSGRHLSFEPRLREGRRLRELGLPTAMMDLSDGLAADLPKMAQASGTGFRLDPDRLPCHADSDAAGALRDGEDYELLFAFPPERMGLFEQAAQELREAGAASLTIIGSMTEAGAGDTLGGGWQHFCAGGLTQTKGKKR